MAILTKERERFVRLTFATAVMAAGALLTVTRAKETYAFLPQTFQNTTWAILGGVLQLIVAIALWVPRFRIKAAIAFVAICTFQVLFMYYHLIMSGEVAMRGLTFIFLVLVLLLCMKTGVMIAWRHAAQSKA